MIKAQEKDQVATESFVFPKPAHPEEVEWAGTPLGKTNTITRTKSRTASYDKIIDEKQGKREELMEAVVNYLATQGKKREILVHDVVVHGIRVRATTNSSHLAEFWKENWYSVPDWKKMTGVEPSGKPQVWVYAFSGVEGEPEAAHYSRSGNTVIFFNTAYYGQLKSWVLGAVGRVLAQEYGIHSIHGACVEKDKKGILYIAPTGTGKSTSSYGLMEYPNSRFHSDDWVYVRYAYTTKEGKKFSPLSVISKQGEEAKGYQCFRYLEEHQSENHTVKGLTLDSKPIEVLVQQIDFSKPLEAYAYLSEKVFYLRCNLVESFPQAAYSILQANLENVPDISPEFLKENASTLENNLKSIRSTKVEFVKKYFEQYDDTKVKDILGRLFAFENARAMLDITKVFASNQVFVNPLEPVKLTTVMLLKRNFKEDLVIETLTLEKFMERLIIGETPQGKREIAYNGYRLVDDDKESAFVRKVEADSKSVNKPLYNAFINSSELPKSLLEEFELFRVMYKSTHCYDLNTCLQNDKQIPDRRSAVETTMKVIAKAMEVPTGTDMKYTLENYRKFIG